jgi:hypothetical protein
MHEDAVTLVIEKVTVPEIDEARVLLPLRPDLRVLRPVTPFDRFVVAIMRREKQGRARLRPAPELPRCMSFVASACRNDTPRTLRSIANRSAWQISSSAKSNATMSR